MSPFFKFEFMGFFDFFGLGDLLSAGVDVANNERNIAMQRETNQLNAQLAREQMQQQIQMQRENNAFNSAEALKAFQREAQFNNESAVVARRISAGLNPVEGGNGISGVSSPVASAAHSGISPTMTHLDAPRSELNLMSEFSAAAAGLKAIADAKKVGVDTSYLEKTLEDRIRRASAEADSEEQRAAILEIESGVKRLYERGIKEKELEILTQNLENLHQDYWVKDAEIALKTAQEIKERAQANYYGKNSEYIEKEIANYELKMNSLINLQKSQQEKNYSSASLNQAYAETENTMRIYQKRAAQLRNDILYNNKVISDETVQAEIDKIIQEGYRAEFITDEERYRALKAMKDNDDRYLLMILDRINFGFKFGSSEHRSYNEKHNYFHDD